MIEKSINGAGFISGSWPLKEELPTLIFISGASSCGNFWNIQIESLKHSFNTLAIDLPGHGKTNGNGEKTIADYAVFVKKFIEDINPPTPILCGFSMGGAITLDLLIKYPQLVTSAIIINSGARLNILPLLLRKIRERDKKNYNFENLFTDMALSKKSDAEKMKLLVAESANPNTQVTLRDVHACNGFNVRKKIRDITVPVLIVTSEEDILTPHENGVYMNENIRNSKLLTIKEAGHLAPLEKPDEISVAISDFVRKTHPNLGLKN